MKTQEDHNKFSRKCKSQKQPFKTLKNMLKHLTGLFNTSKMQFKTEVLSSEDQFMQDKFSQISNAPISTCTENLSNFTNSIMRDVSTQFIQK